MADKITNYQCPACTGPLHFSSASGKLECDYCGSVFDPAEIEALYADKAEAARAAANAEAQKQAEKKAKPSPEDGEWDTAAAGSDWGDELDSLRAYNCPSCGAELICDETTAATSCPYCGNPTVVPGQLGGVLKPDYVIPFKLDKAAAVEALGRHYRKKPFLPKAFSAQNHIEEVKGVYVPFWLFDADAQGDATYHGTRTHTHREGDYEVTTTEHFNIRRSGRAAFRRIPVDGSTKMPDEHMDSIEPFDYSELKDFSLAYLPGYLADKYDVSAGESTDRADKRCRSSMEDILRGDVHGYATVTQTGSNIRLRRGAVKYALLPVWILNTRWKDRDYLFAMNGQTGKLVGDLPVAKGKYWAAFAAITAAVAAALLFTGIGAAVGGFFAELIAVFAD